jgi:hypothetical protein
MFQFLQERRGKIQSKVGPNDHSQIITAKEDRPGRHDAGKLIVVSPGSVYVAELLLSLTPSLVERPSRHRLGLEHSFCCSPGSVKDYHFDSGRNFHHGLGLRYCVDKPNEELSEPGDVGVDNSDPLVFSRERKGGVGDPRISKIELAREHEIQSCIIYQEAARQAVVRLTARDLAAVAADQRDGPVKRGVALLVTV